MKKISLIILIIFSFYYENVFSHALLQKSKPANGEILKKSPKLLVLNFSKNTRLVKLQLSSSTGENIPISFKAQLDLKKEYLFDLPDLVNGEYQVIWVAMAIDSHKMSGEFSFNIVPINDN